MSAPPTVSLFIQCLVDSMFPEVGEAMLNILHSLGLPTRYPPGQTCCGQPAFNSGYRHDAADAAEHFLDVFESAELIVCPSGSCVHMVRHNYPILFEDNPSLKQRALSIAAKTYELTEFLVDHLGITNLDASFNGMVTYHESCHLSKGIGVIEQPRQLLRNVRGLTLVEAENSNTCCGFGGTFSIQYPEISTAMVDDKLDGILATGADTVVGCDMGCLMNIKGRAEKRKENLKVMHIAQILAAREEVNHVAA